MIRSKYEILVQSVRIGAALRNLARLFQCLIQLYILVLLPLIPPLALFLLLFFAVCFYSQLI